MAATTPRTGSFSRNIFPASDAVARNPGLKHGPNGTMLISSGIADLDKILGGGFKLGSLVMVMEDPEAPHHMLLLRNFMSQGLIHHQPLIYASPAKDPKGFLGTLPTPVASKDDRSRVHDSEQFLIFISCACQGEHFCVRPCLVAAFDKKANVCFQFQEKGLRIAWQYKKYLVEHNSDFQRDGKSEFCCDFDLRKPLESSNGNVIGGRVAIQSLCSPPMRLFQ